MSCQKIFDSSEIFIRISSTDLLKYADVTDPAPRGQGWGPCTKMNDKHTTLAASTGTSRRVNRLNTSTAIVMMASVLGVLSSGTAWSAEPDGFQDLGFLNGGGYSYAYAISADGSVVVGSCR